MDSFQPASRPLAEFAMRNSPLLSLCTCGNGAIETPVWVSTQKFRVTHRKPCQGRGWQAGCEPGWGAGMVEESLSSVGGVHAWWRKSLEPGWGGPLATAPLALSFGRAGESLKSDWWFCLKVCKNCIFAVVSRKFYKWKSRNYIKSLFLAACFSFCTEK